MYASRVSRRLLNIETPKHFTVSAVVIFFNKWRCTTFSTIHIWFPLLPKKHVLGFRLKSKKNAPRRLCVQMSWIISVFLPVKLPDRRFHTTLTHSNTTAQRSIAAVSKTVEKHNTLICVLAHDFLSSFHMQGAVSNLRFDPPMCDLQMNPVC